MVETPLIRHGFAVPPSPLWGEGSRSTQIGWNCSHCGTFEYIYWELGRSTPVGERGRLHRGPLIRLAFARHLSPRGKASGRPGVPPLRSEGDLYDGWVWDPPLRRIYEWLCI